MPKQNTRAEINTFVKGLITEASPLNFPANASLDEENFVLKRDGTRERRLGMDQIVEAGDELINAVGQPTYANTEFVWNSPGGDTTKQFLVVQYGIDVTIYDLATLPYTPIAGVTTSITNTEKMSFASVAGFLVIACGVADLFVVKYISQTNSFTTSQKRIKVRDMWGIQESNASLEAYPELRTTVFTESHKYNLANQSWGYLRRNAGGFMVNPVTQYFTDLATYPSNKEQVWSGLQYQPVTPPATPYERMYTNFYEESLGEVIAAKGFFVIDFLNRGSSRYNAILQNANNFPGAAFLAAVIYDETSGGATCVTEYAGRAFYAGFNGAIYQGGDTRSPMLNNYVCFTRLIGGIDDFEKCYQEGDPTSRENNEVIDTDGGFIRISGAERIISLRQLGTKLVVLANNGVWVISGGSDFGFSGANYRVDKLAAYGCVSAQSVLVDGNMMIFWGDDGIYGVSPNQYGDLIVDDMSAPTIQTYYLSIPLESRRTSFGVVDQQEKKFRWIYKGGSFFVGDSTTHELVFDMTLKAFSRNRIVYGLGTNREITGCWFTQDNGVPVYTATVRTGGSYYRIFATYNNTDFEDWGSLDAHAYLRTGHFTAGDSAIKKQVPYLTVHLLRTETTTDIEGIPANQSSCLMTYYWHWANNQFSNKIGPLQEVYRYRQVMFGEPGFTYDNGFQTIVTKNKVRGSGNAISFSFQTAPNKDCKLLGWSITFNGNGIT
jgi:hypothetical protein